MRIISQNFASFPFEQIIVEVDDNSIMCRLCAVRNKDIVWVDIRIAKERKKSF